VLLLLYRPYTAGILWLAHRVSTSRNSMAAFLATIFVVPALLMLLS
jgi:hypothetical protein